MIYLESCLVIIAVVVLSSMKRLQSKARKVSQSPEVEAIDVIQSGHVCMENLDKINMSLDKLHIKLRLAGITDISTVRRATIADNGAFTFYLYENTEPATQA